MYFNDMMFSPQYVSPEYYSQIQTQVAQYHFEQNTEQVKALKAFQDMCEAVKKLDDQHQQELFVACLGVMAKEFRWTSH